MNNIRVNVYIDVYFNELRIIIKDNNYCVGTYLNLDENVEVLKYVDKEILQEITSYYGGK